MKARTAVLALVLFVAPAGATALAAQEGVEPDVGDRVRITTPALVHWNVEGELLSLTSDSLRIRPAAGGATVALSRDVVERFRVSQGRGRATLRGAFVGLIVGFAVGEAIVAGERADGEINPECGQESCRGWGERLLGAGIGIAVGGGVGSRFHFERWADAPPQAPADP